jgi:hypothetical protein
MRVSFLRAASKLVWKSKEKQQKNTDRRDEQDQVMRGCPVTTNEFKLHDEQTAQYSTALTRLNTVNYTPVSAASFIDDDQYE